MTSQLYALGETMEITVCPNCGRAYIPHLEAPRVSHYDNGDERVYFDGREECGRCFEARAGRDAA